jgi:hypothetical protein
MSRSAERLVAAAAAVTAILPLRRSRNLPMIVTAEPTVSRFVRKSPADSLRTRVGLPCR